MPGSGQVAPAVVVVQGRVDASNAPELMQRIRTASESMPSRLVVDLGQVSYISSSGLRVLLLAHREQLSAGAELLLTNVPPKIMRILTMAGFDQVFRIGHLATPSA